jgi:2-oxo-3-hexenedioate decarboxylase
MKITLNRKDIAALAERVEAAQLGATAIPKLTDDFPAMTLADGYAVQLELRRRWLARGRRQVGWKAGLTSMAKMLQMGVENAAVATKGMVHPRVECEVAFVTKRDLAGPGCTMAEVMAATDFVVPAIEIIDSRFTGFKFDLPSVVADNGSAARYVAGGRARFAAELDLATLGVVMEKNGEIVQTGATGAVLGHPAEAVALLVRVLAELDETLPAGSFVMSGAITEAVAVKPGDSVVARFQELGSVSVRFVEEA